ncbi:MAG: hypothetical protein ISS82_00605 [Nanoarchaeota archaeon]|nr:hypothetical protein [Nanoarchaeota archaeon]
MAKIHLKTNLSFLFILICVIVLAILEGSNLSRFVGDAGIMSGEIQQIAFIALTLFILIFATLKPDRIYLSAYSAMTLGLIVILGTLYKFFMNHLPILEFIIGLILIISGFFLVRGTKLSKLDKTFAQDALKKYRK